MAEITMPRLSESMTEGRFLRWCVVEGDEVKSGDVVAEVETDKANMEIEALRDGRVAALLARPGDMVPVGGALGRLEDERPLAEVAADDSSAAQQYSEKISSPLDTEAEDWPPTEPPRSPTSKSDAAPDSIWNIDTPAPEISAAAGTEPRSTWKPPRTAARAKTSRAEAPNSFAGTSSAATLADPSEEILFGESIHLNFEPAETPVRTSKRTRPQRPRFPSTEPDIPGRFARCRVDIDPLERSARKVARAYRGAVGANQVSSHDVVRAILVKAVCRAIVEADDRSWGSDGMDGSPSIRLIFSGREGIIHRSIDDGLFATLPELTASAAERLNTWATRRVAEPDDGSPSDSSAGAADEFRLIDFRKMDLDEAVADTPTNAPVLVVTELRTPSFESEDGEHRHGPRKPPRVSLVLSLTLPTGSERGLTWAATFLRKCRTFLEHPLLLFSGC